MENLIKIKSENGIQLTDRELAVRWWGRLSTEEKESLLKTFLPTFSIDKVDYETQYWIWLKQQVPPRNLR
jgi:hypothetical protein